MTPALLLAQSLSRWSANVPIGEVPAAPPLKPDIERFKDRNPQQRRRPPFQKKPEKDPTQPDDAHKVDDYA